MILMEKIKKREFVTCLNCINPLINLFSFLIPLCNRVIYRVYGLLFVYLPIFHKWDNFHIYDILVRGGGGILGIDPGFN